MTDRPTVQIHGYGTIELAKGYVGRGSVNTTSQVADRPPAPAPMRPAGSAAPPAAPAAAPKPK